MVPIGYRCSMTTVATSAHKARGTHGSHGAAGTCDDPKSVYLAACPCRDMLDILANKWSALALGAMEDGPQRFSALRNRLQGVSPKVLTQTLRRLEDNGLVSREIFAEVPVRVEYSLTPLGEEACVPLAQLRTFVELNIDRFPGAV
ncbi:DNA-binding HxlR family transcriptional regulator [Catenulispora sp. EB89]